MQQPEAAGAKVQQRFDNLNYNDIKKGKQLKFLRVSCDKLERFRSFVRSRGTETSLFSKNANLQLTRGESCGIIIDVAGNARRATMESAAVAHLVERHLAKVEVASSSLVGRSIGVVFITPYMVTWPSGKARVCKTLIHQFKSGRHLQKIPGSFGFRDFLFCTVPCRRPRPLSQLR